MSSQRPGYAVLSIWVLMAVLAFAGAAAGPMPACCADNCAGCPQACPGVAGRGPGPMGPGKARHHEAIHELMRHHDQIQRDVADIEGGVETLTTTDDPELVAQIRKHVRQMESRMRAGHGMRHWDPLFAELFRQHDKIRIEISDIDGGVRVRETSDEPRVAELIRRHARAVSEFVHDGPPRMHRPTSLPEGYAPGH